MKCMDNEEHSGKTCTMTQTARYCFYMDSLSMMRSVEPNAASDRKIYSSIAEAIEAEQQQIEQELEYLNSWENILEFI